MRSLNALWVAALVAGSVAAGSAHSRDPREVRCRAMSEDGASLQVRYEGERRKFRADFQVLRGSREFEERFASDEFADTAFARPFQPGDQLPVRVEGQLVGMIVLDQSLAGRLSFDEHASAAADPRADGAAFPANFPPFPAGTLTSVGALSCTSQRR